MKVTKNQLKRIIKEEKAKLLHESITDMRHYEDMIETFAFEITDRFMLDEGNLYEEEPSAFKQSPQEWNREVQDASSDLDRRIVLAVAQAMREVESALHDGEYSKVR